MMRKLKLCSLLAAAGLYGTAVQAAPETYVDPLANNGAALAPAGDALSQLAFAYADRNADLYVSWEEYRNRAMRLFANIDTNGDGILEIAEVQAFAGPDSKPIPQNIGIAEFNSVLNVYFSAADKDKDGALSPAEWRNVVRPGNIANQMH